jgi:histidinol phosphatase-like enzyme (inositol monophosphatase family)
MVATDAAGRVVPAELLPFALDLVAEAGTFTQRFFRSPDLEVVTKADGSPVTLADEGAEQLIRTAIAAEFPDDAIMGEEFGASPAGSGRQWVIDPIDGTKSFTAGVPLYSNLLAIVDDGVPVLGIINLPALDEMIWATTGGGAYANGSPCAVSTKASLDGAYVMTSSVRYWPETFLDRVLDFGMVLRTWGDAYGYAMVATGRAEAMIDPRANVWDIAPIGVILTEAGGSFTDLTGNPRIDAGNGIGTNGAIHAAMTAAFPAREWR